MKVTVISIHFIFFITLRTYFDSSDIFSFPIYFFSTLFAYNWPLGILMKYDQSSAMWIAAEIHPFTQISFGRNDKGLDSSNYSVIGFDGRSFHWFKFTHNQYDTN